MNEPEEFERREQPQSELKEEITPPEIESPPEINVDHVIEHAQISAETINAETTRTLDEAEHRVQAAAESLNLAPEELAAARQEFGLDAKLAVVAEEATDVASDAKTEIAHIVAEEPASTELSENPDPEELNNQRLQAIMRELEATWESKNGPMHRNLSQREIQQSQDWDQVMGRQWDGRTTRMTDAAMEFFFDFRGKGENSVPSQAKKILAERFPESATTEAPQSETPLETPAEMSEPSRMERIARVFESAGIQSHVVTAENAGEFSDIIFLDKEATIEGESDEKQVRLFRGINHLDNSVLEQLPYALRVKDAEGNITAAEDLREAVANLAENPTYDNLKQYADKMRGRLTPEEVQRFDNELRQIQDVILSGYSTRQELVFGQIKHGGGVGETGITPYVSATIDPYVAAKYGREGIMIIDMPFSQFEIMNREVMMKGVLDPKYITAIVPRRQGTEVNDEEFQQHVHAMLEQVYAQSSEKLYDDKAFEQARDQKQAENAERDKQQWEIDVALVRQERTDELAQQFPEVDLTNLGADTSDIYAAAKGKIYDFYKERFAKLGRASQLEEYDYEDAYNQPKKFDRDKADDTMLLKLRTLVDHLQKRQAERERA